MGGRVRNREVRVWAKDFPRRSLRVPIFVPLVDYSKDS
jgi:hypothetical protein